MATRRGYYRAELMRAKDNLEMALTHLVRVRDAYDEQHPEVGEAIQQIGDVVVFAGDAIQKIHDNI
jgi:hypothetical protein